MLWRPFPKIIWSVRFEEELDIHQYLRPCASSLNLCQNMHNMASLCITAVVDTVAVVVVIVVDDDVVVVVDDF